MGGMFAILKVRDAVDTGTGESWYKEKPENQAHLATDYELSRDGIEA